MALEKTKELPEGYSANYWRISEFHSNQDSDNVSVTVKLYKDKVCREGGAPNIGNPEAVSFTLNLSDVLKILYPKLKESILVEGQETNFFVDAKDV